MASIPADVIPDILACLAVKDLFRFRCVSKFFISGIDSPNFSKLHLFRSKKTQIHLYGVSELVRFKNPQNMLFDVSNTVNNVSVVMVNRPPGLDPAKLWIVVGSCNGLIALRLSSVKDRGRIMFWNPFTGKFKEVASVIPHDSPVTYGFGYDPKTDDYKLVRIAEFCESEHRRNQVTLKTEIYSLKTNVWKEVGKDLSLNCKDGSWDPEPGVLVNNALHWLNCYENNDKKIVAFDLVNEEFYYVSIGFQYDYYLKLSFLDGCLAATCDYNRHNYVWFMKEYGMKESWTKLLSYSWAELRYRYSGTPLAYSSSRDKVLLSCNSSWYWYDLIGEKLNQRCLNKVGRLGTEEVKLFSGSLVAPDYTTDMVNLKRKQTVTIVESTKNKLRKRRGEKLNK